MSNYWAERMQRQRDAITNKTNEAIEKQLKRYYRNAIRRVIKDFEATYDKLLAAIEDGKQPTPADLYKLDRYWQMQAQLKAEMQKLGDKEVALLSRQFEKEWKEIYESTALPSKAAFSTISLDNERGLDLYEDIDKVITSLKEKKLTLPREYSNGMIEEQDEKETISQKGNITDE